MKIVASPFQMDVKMDAVSLPQSKSLRHPTVLVVDDEENFLNLTARVLSKEGYHVVTAGDGVHALAHADREKIPLAVVDINMEPMTGVDVLAELKKRDPTTHVIIVSGAQTESTRNECARLGAEAYLRKPIEMAELKAVLHGLLGADQSPSIHENRVDNHGRSLLCPNCDSTNVRPSHLYNLVEKAVSLIISPYRCLDCEYRFWKIN
jgi:DNA-binding response OmpR family regulator